MAIDVTVKDGVLTILLNRPESLNAFNPEFHAAFGDALGKATDPRIRAVVVTGIGRAFSAGQDLNDLEELRRGVDGSLRRTYHPNILAMRALEKPVIGAINGVCAGAGLSLACACDIRIAAASASFVPGFIGIGLVPDSGATFFIARLLGASRAFEWMISNRRLDSAEAREWGLVSEVVDDDALASRAAHLGARCAALPTGAVGMTKRLFENAPSASLASQLELEAQSQAVAFAGPEFAEGLDAFRAKRSAVWP